MKIRVFRIFVVFLFIVPLMGCAGGVRNYPSKAPESGTITNINKVKENLEELGRINVEWLTQGDGWIHYERQPSQIGGIKFTYQERWTEFPYGTTACGRYLWIIRATVDSIDGQRHIRLADGTKAELISLGEDFMAGSVAASDSIDKTECDAVEISGPLLDLQRMDRLTRFIKKVNMWDGTYNGQDVRILEVLYLGELENELPAPAGSEGKVERLYYDVSTGNRIRIEEMYLNDDQWGGDTYAEESYEYTQGLSADVLNMIDLAEMELDYYLGEE